MNWNPVLNKFIEIKNTYITKFGNITYDYVKGYSDESETCLERWVKELGIPEYIDILSCLELNQFKNRLLIRYARYSNVYDGEVENSGEDFWDRYDGFYRECRSLVIDVVNDCIILAPYKKFFNIGEVEETSLENVRARINTAKCIEFSNKLDGSMQSATWYNGEIVMAGSQMPDPELSWRLADGYRMINSNPGYKEMLQAHPTCTFIFEYISLRDAHVVKYTKDQEGLYLIGVRRIKTGKELSYNCVIALAEFYNIPTTEIIDKTLDEVMMELDDKKSDEAEGFVINIDDYRVKLKYNDYVHIHKALSKLSSINLIIRSIANNQYDDLLAKLPAAYHNNVKKVASIVVRYINQEESKIREYYNKAPKSNNRDFMIWVTNNVPKEYQGYCRAMYLGQEINVIKSGNEKAPHYKKLKDMGVTDYNSIFLDGETNE